MQGAMSDAEAADDVPEQAASPRAPRSSPSSPCRPRRHRRGPTYASTPERPTGTADEERRALELRARRLEEQLQGLREAYARKIAHTELKCEQLLRDKDDSNSTWYKAKRIEIMQMSSAVTIMQALYKRRSSKHEAKMLTDREEFERERSTLQQEKDVMRLEHDRVLDQCARTIQERTSAYEKRLADAAADRAAAEENRRRLEQELRESRTTCAKLQETNETLRRETEELRRRVVDLERSEELAKRSARIEELEVELKRLRKSTQEKRHAETEALRKELMDYVKFIVRVLPDDWQTRGCGIDEEDVPRDLRVRLASQQASAAEGAGSIADIAEPDSCRSDPRSPKSPKSPSAKVLPPVAGVSHAGASGRKPSPDRCAYDRQLVRMDARFKNYDRLGHAALGWHS